MHDRVVDRAAPHTTAARLAVRDWLLVALSFSTGMYEAISFLSFGKVFTAFQTGNIVFLGVAAAGTRPPAGPDPISVVVSLVAFAAGAVLAVQILKAFDGDEEVEDDNVFLVWPRRVSVALGVVLLVQVAFLAVWVTTSPSSMVTYMMLGLNAFGMGLQMNAIRSLHVPGVSTTAFTATFISLVSAAATWSLTAHSVRRLTATMISLAAGAFLGDWMLGHANPYAPVVPAIVIAVVIAIAFVALKPDATDRVDGEQGQPVQPAAK